MFQKVLETLMDLLLFCCLQFFAYLFISHGLILLDFQIIKAKMKKHLKWNYTHHLIFKVFKKLLEIT